MSRTAPVDASDFDLEVVVGAPTWSLNGVNVFSERLVRGLRARGVAAHLLVSGEEPDDARRLPRPTDLPIHTLDCDPGAPEGRRRERMIDYLRERTPCLYLPNHDYALSCVAPALPDDVGIVGVVHSDDPQHYTHVRHLGRYWNATVAVSTAIAERIEAADWGTRGRLHTILHGVECETRYPRPAARTTPTADEPIRLVYVGRLIQYQKRVFDVLRVLAALDARGVAFELTFVGGGPDRNALVRAARRWVERGTVHFAGVLPPNDVRDLLARHDALVLVSEFEGLPTNVLEGMAAGCVPVVTALRSGIPEIVRDDHNGFAIAVGDIAGFADRIGALALDATLRTRLSRAAHATIVDEGFRLDAMVDRYCELFTRVAKSLGPDGWSRPAGVVEPLPFLEKRRLWHRLPASWRREILRARSHVR